MAGLLSVIVPVYNAEKYLPKCLDSIRNQTYEDIEVILINDGSTDNSENICEHYVKNDRRFILYNITNSGPACARNMGLEVARGDYISFVDSDDYIEPDIYEKLIYSIEHDMVQMAICNWYIYMNAKKRSDIGEKGIIKSKKLTYIIVSDDEKGGGGYLWNKVICKKTIYNNSGQLIKFNTEVDVYEDKIWLLKVLKNVHEIMLMDYVGYNYIVHEKSLTNRRYSDRIDNFIKAWKLIERELDDKLTKSIYEFRTLWFLTYFWNVFKERRSDLIQDYWYDNKSTVRLGLKGIREYGAYILIELIYKMMRIK